MTFDEALLLENWCIHYHKTVWVDNTRLTVESWKTADLLNMDSGCVFDEYEYSLLPFIMDYRISMR